MFACEPCPIHMRHWNASTGNSRPRGFTLIELLVVVTIIGILAGLIVSAFASVGPKAKIAVAQAELAQMETAIKDYHQTLGFFPPDNPNSPSINPLYFELLGTTNDGNTYVTLDASGEISNTNGDIHSTFGRDGFANSSTKAHSSDQSGAPVAFLNRLGPRQFGSVDIHKPPDRILVCSVE